MSRYWGHIEVREVATLKGGTLKRSKKTRRVKVVEIRNGESVLDTAALRKAVWELVGHVRPEAMAPSEKEQRLRRAFWRAMETPR